MGPEESGHESSGSWTGFSGSLSTLAVMFLADRVAGVGVWLGPASTKLLVRLWGLGVFSLVLLESSM